MSKPILLAVDDEPDVLRSIQRDLADRYEEEYRIVGAGSGVDALNVVRRLKQRDDEIALVVSDQRMPEMDGTEFLAGALSLYPNARTVLLTAYADTAAASRSINEIGLDYYLMKPWDSPELGLYPVFDDLLESWQVTTRRAYNRVRVAGTLWSARSHEVEDFLARNRIPYLWLDVEKDETARALVEGVDAAASLPVVFLQDGTPLLNPDRNQLGISLGMKTRASTGFYDLIVVGGGPGGLAAAVYGASEGLSTALIEQEATGGQEGTSSRIENYLGFPKGLSGADLAHRAVSQAERLGTEILSPQRVEGLRLDGDYKIVSLADGTELTCRALVLATGMKVRRLQADGCDRLAGRGIYYGSALSEAAFYRGQPVSVIGGGNSAGQSALHFSRYASSVKIHIRRNDLSSSMSQYLIDQIEATDGVEVHPRCDVLKVTGDERLESLVLKTLATGENETVTAAAMFIFIGSIPHSQLVENLVAREEKGFVVTGPDLPTFEVRPRGWRLDRDPYLLETSVLGIFAVGDVRF